MTFIQPSQVPASFTSFLRATWIESKYACASFGADGGAVSVAPHDAYRLLLSITSKNRHRLRWAARHIWSFGRRYSRGISMCPIPGNIVRIGVVHIA